VFRVSPGATVAAELDPAVLTRDWVRAAAFHGLSRASIGVQDLSPRVQAAVNRIEPFEVIERAVGWLREAGVLSVNLDLMYGLPRQTVADVNNTLDAVLTLKPERLALFGYAHVPWMKANQQLIQDSELPGPAERLDQSEFASERLQREGYVRIGLDHYALPDDELARALAEQRLHRNFQGYTTDANSVLLGVGVSSISRLPQGFVQNQGLERNWRDAILRGELPAARGVALTDEDRFRGEIIERLMCDLAVDVEDEPVVGVDVGAVLALVGLIFMPIVILVGLATVYDHFATHPDVIAATKAAAAGAVGLMFGTAYKIGKTVVTTRWALLFAVLSFVSIGFLRLPLVGTLLVLGPISVAVSFWRGQR
jgi:coproporphyrinogen III oxidase-like Fe-S oxidoreductase